MKKIYIGVAGIILAFASAFTGIVIYCDLKWLWVLTIVMLAFVLFSAELLCAIDPEGRGRKTATKLFLAVVVLLVLAIGISIYWGLA